MATTILDQDTVKLNHDAYYVEANLTAVGDTVGGEIDAIAYQSVSAHVGAGFTGTVAFEVQNAFGQWISKNLVSSTGVESSQSSAGAMWSADLGARKFRARVTALTAGTVPIGLVFMPESQANLRTLNSAQTITGTTNANMRPVSSSGRLNNTNLAANATYTGTTVDRGTDLTAGDTRVRFMVRHLAALTFGHLAIEESLDGTTWIETRRTPVPSDGLYHSFDWPVHLRFWRPKFINGAVAQTAFDLQHQASRGDGSSIDTRNVLTFVLTNTPLAANGYFASPAMDLGGNHDWTLLRASLRQDIAGGPLRIEYSDNATDWDSAGDAYMATTGAGSVILESKIMARYARVAENSSTTAAQTVHRLRAALVSL